MHCQFAGKKHILRWLPDLRCTCVGAFLPAQQLRKKVSRSTIESSSGLMVSYDGKGIVTEEYAENMPYHYHITTST